MATSFRKSFPTYFLPGYGEAEKAHPDSVRYQRETLLRWDDDPLYPNTLMGTGEDGGFRAEGFNRVLDDGEAGPKDRAGGIQARRHPPFRAAPVPRQAREIGSPLRRSVEKVWAVSQNIGHSGMLTTLGSYGGLPDDRRRELILHEC